MMKIDFHIHTVATQVDVELVFDIAKLKEYVAVMAIDGIAITNHNLFDHSQYKEIAHALDIVVLPGIEINLGKGHALLIGDVDNVEDFTSKCQKVEQLVKVHSDNISVSQLREIYGDLSKYIVIPHYDKNPAVDPKSLEELGSDFIAGEVTSPKKFIYALKDDESKTPMLFSDTRAKADWDFKTRQTFIDISKIDIASIRRCLNDKTKVALSAKEGSELIQVTPDGVTVSSHLTVLLGGRSSGKSYTLDEIADYNENTKYIRQFDLIEKDPDAAAKKFTEGVGQKQRDDGDKYLRQFKNVVDDVKNISLADDERKVQDFIDTLLTAALETERHDAFSKSTLYTESPFLIADSEKITKLISATITLLNPGIYDTIINQHINNDNLRSLLISLIERYRQEELIKKKREWVNSLVVDVKQTLSSVSAVTRIKEVDLVEVAKNRSKIEKFTNITIELKKPRTIQQKQMQRFVIREQSVPISGAGELKEISGKVASFQGAFTRYGNPYDFLMELKNIYQIDSTSYYKFFTKIEYKILNEYGVDVSGGERAEFKLLSEIEGAGSFDMLLIDEPESSFDNIFLSSDVNKMIKNIAKNTPVILVTHNNTVGASIKPDSMLYTERTIQNGSATYRVYSGRATDNILKSPSGATISNKEVMLKYLEAGETEYGERRGIYENLAD